MTDQQIIIKIKESLAYQQIMNDSFGGIMYNVANRSKYNTNELIKLWNALTPAGRESAGGIMKGAFNFLQGNE